MGCVNTKGSMKVSSGRSRGQGDKPIAQPIARNAYYSARSGRSHAAARRTDDPPKAPTTEEAKTDLERAVLKILSVDYNIAQNTATHHTDSYEITQEQQEEEGVAKTTPQLVVRRGESFDITLKFDRDFDAAKDDLKLVFDAGSEPRESRGTRVVMILSDDDHPREWGAKTVKNEADSITVRIFTPPNCYVAKWEFKLDTIIRKEKAEGEDGEAGSKVFRFTNPNPVYIIFNPWCPDDQVYLDDESMRNEYVLNDTGMIYRGSAKQISAKPWNFGQFEDFMLDCCLSLLDQSGLSWRMRGSSINIARKVSALANAPDDNGVLVGNWSGEYSGGTSPLDWVGSVRIMEKYWKTKEPVSFGQCWVFSGIVTTIARCLGIPARSVTNFASAHDTDGSITIDCHWTTDGEPLEEFNKDSVWNFHVWNEVFMSRPDLPSGYGGWQAIDATPQETSDGVYCSGPCSVEALKNGLVNLLYDGAFIFAETNADRINWIQKTEGGWANTKQSYSIGKHISTKGPHGFVRMDITNLYKYPEGSQQERTSVWRAAKEGSTRRDVYKSEEEDMFFDLIEKEDAKFGEGFDVTVKARNESKEDRKVNLTLTARSVYYTGVPAGVIKKETYTVTAPTNAAGEISMKVDYEDYADKVVDMCGIKISLMANVEATGQIHCESDDFRLMKPDLCVEAPKEVAVGEEYEVELHFHNPLPKILTKCEFSLEGAGLQKGGLTFKQANVDPKGEVKAKAKLRAKRTGTRYLSVCFRSEEISDVTGHTTIQVVPAPPKPVEEEKPAEETTAEETPAENNAETPAETPDETPTE